MFDTNELFTTFKAAPTQKAEPLKLFQPLNGYTDVSDWASNITPEGNIVAKEPESYFKILDAPEVKIEEYTPTTTSQMSSNIKGDKKKAMEFFLNKGLSSHAAAGIVGNLIVESGLQTGIRGDGGKAFGMAQWHPDRLKGLLALAKSRGTNASDFETLLEWVWQELNTSEKKALDKLMSAKNVKEAAVSFMKYYERPGTPHTERRIKEAQSLLS